MGSEEIFMSALEYEIKIRDLYLSAQETVLDSRGKKIFKALAEDEQSHVDFLNYSLDTLKADKQIDITKLETSIPTLKKIDEDIEKMRSKVPDNILGDLKRVLSSALKLEIETSEFYRNACNKTKGPIKAILKKFLEIEQRHENVVQIELDHISNYGCWFDFMEIDMEHG